MDWITGKQQIKDWIKKYRYVVLVLMIGLLLMLLPDGEPTAVESIPPAEPTQPHLEDALSEILSRLDGAGKVEVLLTEAFGEETIFQSNEDVSPEDLRKDTVLITTADREEAGLIRQINPPKYQGAIVLCQGANNAAVKLAIVEAVKSVTGLSSDRITVLKMK